MCLIIAGWVANSAGPDQRPCIKDFQCPYILCNGNSVLIRVVVWSQQKVFGNSRVVFNQKHDSNRTIIDVTVCVHVSFTQIYFINSQTFKLVNSILVCSCRKIKAGKPFTFVYFPRKWEYSRLSLFRRPRDSLKYFEISVPRHIRFAEFRKN